MLQNNLLNIPKAPDLLKFPKLSKVSNISIFMRLPELNFVSVLPTAEDS